MFAHTSYTQVPAKNVLLFCQAMACLQPFLLEHELTPVLCGAGADAGYAHECRQVDWRPQS